MMILSVFACLSVVSLALTTPSRDFLTNADARDIVAQYKSILEGSTYNGQPPNVTGQNVIAPDYHEISDSILMLAGAPLGGASSTSRSQFLAGVGAHTTKNITTHDILVAGGTNVLWYWTFPNVGNAKYPIKGFNLLRINHDKQIYQANIEFNNIARGIDTNMLQRWCQ